jgi:hypothetical protein
MHPLNLLAWKHRRRNKKRLTKNNEAKAQPKHFAFSQKKQKQSKSNTSTATSLSTFG